MLLLFLNIFIFSHLRSAYLTTQYGVSSFHFLQCNKIPVLNNKTKLKEFSKYCIIYRVGLVKIKKQATRSNEKLEQ